MKLFLGTQLMVACALALGACALDETPADDNTSASGQVDSHLALDNALPADGASADDAQLVVPDELSFDNLSDPASADGYDDDHGKKHKRCHRKFKCDRYSYKASYCDYGKCDDYYDNEKDCYDRCGHKYDCKNVYYDGKCHKKHHDGKHHDPLAPDDSDI